MFRMATNERGPSGDEASDGRRPTDEEIRAIAERLVAEAGMAPPASPPAEMSAQTHQLSAADEARVEAAVVELRAADAKDTTRSERAAGQDGDRTITEPDAAEQQRLIDAEMRRTKEAMRATPPPVEPPPR
jgi:hypothetical protein